MRGKTTRKKSMTKNFQFFRNCNLFLPLRYINIVYAMLAIITNIYQMQPIMLHKSDIVDQTNPSIHPNIEKKQLKNPPTYYLLLVYTFICPYSGGLSDGAKTMRQIKQANPDITSNRLRRIKNKFIIIRFWDLNQIE